MFWAARALHWCIQRVWPALRGVGNLLNLHRAGDRLLELLILNEEFLVSVSHQLALNTSLPFVHTARRSYRLNGPVKCLDCEFLAGSPVGSMREVHWTLSFRGRRSRNKVSVGEPAEGSFLITCTYMCHKNTFFYPCIFFTLVHFSIREPGLVSRVQRYFEIFATLF